MRQFKLRPLTIVIILSFTLTLLAPVSPVWSQHPETVSDLWLDISLGPPLVNWFNQVARPDDIARVDHVERIDLLDQVTVGRKLVVFKSVAEAERLIPLIADKIDIVGYNLEHGLANPVNEQADPVGNAKRMRHIADQYDLSLAFGPDHRFALSDGPAVAPFVDIFVLQVQRAQTDPMTVRDFVLPLVPKLRRANPDLQISVQVRTEGDVVALTDLVDSMKEALDGVSILTSPETVPVAEALVLELQTRESSSASDRNISSTDFGVETDKTTPFVNGSKMSDPPSILQDSITNLQIGGSAVIWNATLFWILTMAGAFVVGAFVGSSFTALILRRK